jgi:hypothetical protein
MSLGLAIGVTLALTGMAGGRLVAGRLAGPLLQRGFALLSSLVAVGMIARVLA